MYERLVPVVHGLMPGGASGNRVRARRSLRSAIADSGTLKVNGWGVTRPWYLNQVVQLYRQVADALAGGMEDCVGDGGRNAGDADLADAARAGGIELTIVFLAEADVDEADVGVHRHVVLREVGVDDAAIALIHQRLFEERHADAPDNAAHHLAARELRVHQPADAVVGHDARHDDAAEVLVDAHLDEHPPERAGGHLLRLLALFRRGPRLDRLVAAPGGARRVPLLPRVLARLLDRGSDARHRGRAARHARRRHQRVAEFEAHLVRRQAKGVGGDLRHHRIGSGADVLR